MIRVRMAGIAVACGLAVLATAAIAQAQTVGWYAGGEVGFARVEFRPYYEYVVGVPDQYRDRANGVDVAVLAGREWTLAPRVTMAAQGLFSYTRSRWSATFTEGEHSTLTYDIGPSLALSAVPAFRLSPRVSLTAEAGAGRVRIHELKASTDSSRYDAEPWRWCYVAGVGGRVELAPRLRALITYRYQHASSFTYHSFLPDGTQWETITDAPVLHRVTAGLAYRF